MDYPLWTLGRSGVRLVDLFRKTNSLALYPGIAASQWETPAALAERQWALALPLLEHGFTKVPYYRRLLAERGLSPADFQSPADLQQLPVLTKEIIRAEGLNMRAEDFEHWRPRAKATSGSTGVPLSYYIDRLSHSHHWAFIWRAWEQSGFRPGMPWATLSGGALVPAKVDFKQKTYLWLNGALHLPSYHLTEADFQRYADLLRGRKLPLLYAYPSSLRLFARWLGERKIAIPLAAFFTTSEQLPRAWRDEIEAGTSGQVFDIYGNNDGGILAFECERHDGYHLNVEGVLVEIVDDAGRQVAPGESGEILSTNLLNYAMPFIRYAPGDGGSLLQTHCSCGRGLQRLGSLEGRVRDIVIAPDGRRVHGAFFNHFEPFYRTSWIEGFQVHQRRAGAMTLRLQTTRRPDEDELAPILAELHRGLGEDMRIDLEFVEEIPRSKAGKHRLIVSELDP